LYLSRGKKQNNTYSEKATTGVILGEDLTKKIPGKFSKN
jgi:hypothetical protein